MRLEYNLMSNKSQGLKHRSKSNIATLHSVITCSNLSIIYKMVQLFCECFEAFSILSNFFTRYDTQIWCIGASYISMECYFVVS